MAIFATALRYVFSSLLVPILKFIFEFLIAPILQALIVKIIERRKNDKK